MALKEYYKVILQEKEVYRKFWFLYLLLIKFMINIKLLMFFIWIYSGFVE
ncbi:hypothetical protein T296_22750 [Pantoea agglomerans Eh318]|nr:hypothetical protein T296_22750 [Pantoea agglomerans Eh318]